MAETATSTRAPAAHPSNTTPTHSGTFDPADWLARYTALGGVYVANGKLNLCVLVGHQTAEELAKVRDMIAAVTDDDKAALLAHINAEKAPRRTTWEDVVARCERADEVVLNHPFNDASSLDPNYAELDADCSAACAEDRQAYLGLLNFPAPDHSALSYKIRTVANAYEIDDEATIPILRDLDRLGERAMEAPRPDADSALLGAWEQRCALFSSLETLPESDNTTPEEAKIWEQIKAAEDVIRSQLATTPAGVSAQLFAGLHGMSPDFPVDQASQIGSLAPLEAHESKMDRSERLLLAALRSLKSMEA